jgi:hypothetical protein
MPSGDTLILAHPRQTTEPVASEALPGEVEKLAGGSA